ncbi:MAG: PKD domain-containing protein, partial [Gammaproteobacteria bacterium]|nr:PKD domain-containing protein [Gammaproteobacteria bacterium]
FGDGTNGTGIVVNNSYAQDGNYTVTLSVTDDDGATASMSAVKTVLNRPPVAVFAESADIVFTDDSITFNAGDSYDPDGVIVSYLWDFGDGTSIGSVVIVVYAYADDGNYTVTLTVTDDDGATASATAIKTVLNRSPVASFTESAETVYTSDVVTFNASDSYDSDGSIVSHFWDFGDSSNATGSVVDHAYADDGNYTVTLTVTDDDGATDSVSATKTVLNKSPVASFTESAATVYTGNSINFNASDSYDPDGNIINYLWDFGDGSNTTGEVASHSYTDDGNYTVTLTVTDDDGAADSATSLKTVLNRSPVATFTESSETVYTSETITFNASNSYDPDGTVVGYFWNFGDGTNATGETASHSYTDDGNYTITLTVTDDDGATATSTAAKTVLNRPPVPSFSESAETVYTGEYITFNASDCYDSDGWIVEYFWDFGDGSNATDVVVVHS